ncbi:MAG: hypothetical protein ACI96G_001381, partial [Flavobacterium sp.]
WHFWKLCLTVFPDSFRFALVKTMLVFFIIIDLEFLTTVIHRFSPIFFSEITISDIAHKLQFIFYT